METTSTGARCALSRFHSRFRSSSNIVALYRNQHKRIAAEVLSAKSLTAKKDAMECALERARRNQPTLPELFGVQNREPGTSTYPSRDVVRRVVAHLNSPSRQAGFISNRAQAVKELAEAIATELEEWND